MPAKLLSRCILYFGLFSLTAWAVRAQSTPSPEPPKSSFSVSSRPFTADDLAQELGYEFHGYTYHFTQPVYGRLKITTTPSDSALPKDPQHPLPPPYTVALSGPANEVTLRLLKREEREGPRGHVPTGIQLTYKVSLRSKEVDQEAARRLRAARAVFSDTLTDEFDYHDTGYAATEMVQRLQGGPGLRYMPAGRGTGSGVLFPKKEMLKQLADDMTKPDGTERAETEKARWQAFAEEQLLSRPVDVLHDTADMVTEDKTVKQHAEFIVTLEFSREPFKEDDKNESKTP